MLFPVLLAATLQAVPAAGVRPAIVPRDYLIIDPVDRRGRRPFQPDVVYRDHLWKSGATPPVVGQSATGERGVEQSWKATEANARGALSGSMGYAYTTVEMAHREVRLAKLSGAWTLYVNGRAYFGDAYRFGFGGVPVVLDKGINHLFITGIRGGFALEFPGTAEGVLRGAWDETRPHLVAGEPAQGTVGIELTNLQEFPTGPIKIDWEGPGIEAASRLYPEGLQALGANQFALLLSGPIVAEGESVPLTVRVTYPDPNAAGARPGESLEFTLELEVRGPGQKRIRTYLSMVDESVQEYALVPPLPGDGAEDEEWMGLALSLHGASVSSWGQANCYRQRPDFWVVAAMNRRPYGFDWQDWGRRDAYDVLQLALQESGVDPRFKYVTGHSMGGHGTWHLAANDLDGFAACAPSAGWESFDSYGGRPDGALTEVWHAADASSRTLDLIGNLKQLPTFILHGTADDNVPAREALSMMAALTKAGGSFESHFEGGAKHWWGNQCVDWPPFFEFFREHSIPVDPLEVDFRSVDPSVDADHHWLRVEQPRKYGRMLRVHGNWDESEQSVHLSTENVALFCVSRSIVVAVLDGQRLELDPGREQHWFRRASESWTYEGAGPGVGEKRAGRSGPLKNAFDKRFVLVVGTGGTAEENAAMLASAQLHAGSWRYRANGRAPILKDIEAQGRELTGNLILYGNRDINAAFSNLPEDCPVVVSQGRIELAREGGALTLEGHDLGAVFLYPRTGHEQNLVGVFAFTGLAGARLSSNLQPFKSGAGYPDYTLYSSEVLTTGDGGVIETGWFDSDWRMPSP